MSWVTELARPEIVALGGHRFHPQFHLLDKGAAVHLTLS